MHVHFVLNVLESHHEDADVFGEFVLSPRDKVVLKLHIVIVFMRFV